MMPDTLAPRSRWHLLEGLLLAAALILLFLVPFTDDVANTGEAAWLTGTDESLSIALRFSNERQARERPLPDFDWDDFARTRRFRASLPELYPDRDGPPPAPSFFFAHYVGVSRPHAGFRDNTFYFNWQFRGEAWNAPLPLFLRAASNYCAELAAHGIAAVPDGDAIRRDASMTPLLTMLVLLKALAAASLFLLPLLVVHSLRNTPAGPTAARRFFHWLPLFLALCGVLVFLVAGGENAPNNAILLGLGALPVGTLVLSITGKRALLRRLLVRGAFLFACGVVGLVAARFEDYADPQFGIFPAENLLLARAVRIKVPETGEARDRYGWFELPATADFRHMLLREERPGIEAAEARPVLERYPFPAALVVGRGQDLAAGETWFTMTATEKKGGPERSALIELFEFQFAAWQRRLAAERIIAEASLDAPLVVSPYPTPAHDPRPRALVALVFAAAGGFLLVRKGEAV